MSQRTLFVLLLGFLMVLPNLTLVDVAWFSKSMLITNSIFGWEVALDLTQNLNWLLSGGLLDIAMINDIFSIHVFGDS